MRKAGFYQPSQQLNRCINCGGKTKYGPYCTKYRCRQLAGTAGMYNKRA
jgi:hypothetical protein